MKETPRNKMIGNEDENTKGSKSSGKKLGKQVKSWYFPHYQKTVVAETFEEAEAIINKEMSK